MLLVRFTLIRVQFNAECLRNELESVYESQETINNLSEGVDVYNSYSEENANGLWQAVRQAVTELQLHSVYFQSSGLLLSG